MSEQDLKAGQSGAPWHPLMNREDFEAGQAKRKAEDAILGAGAGPKVEVPGVAYTLIMAAPFLPFVYPVLGWTLTAAVAGVVALSFALPTPKEAEIFPGLVLCVLAFFPGYFLERKASQLGLYRILRTCVRLAGPVVVLMFDFNDGQLSFIGPGAISRASGAGLFGGLVVLLIINFVCSLLDRLYFPVKAEVLRQREQLAKGQAPTRGLGKRWLYGLLWLLPVLVACSIAGNTAVKHAAPEQIETLRPVGYLAGLAVWFLLCVLGLLPGTSKRKKLLIDPNLVDV